MQLNRTLAVHVADLQHVFLLHHFPVAQLVHNAVVDDALFNVVSVDTLQGNGHPAGAALNDGVTNALQYGVGDNGFPKHEGRFVGIGSVLGDIARRVIGNDVAPVAICVVQLQVQTGQSAGNLVDARIHRANAHAAFVCDVFAGLCGRIEANGVENVLWPVKPDTGAGFLKKLL